MALKLPRAVPGDPGPGNIVPSPPDESVSVGDIGPVPKSRAGMARFALTKVNEVTDRLRGIQEALTRSEHDTRKRVEFNGSINSVGFASHRLGSPTAGTYWVIHRVILSLQGDPADDPTVMAFPGIYLDRKSGRIPSNMFLPLFLPSLIGSTIVSTGVTYDLEQPAVYRGIDDLMLWVDYSGTITADVQVYCGLDIQVLPEAPSTLEIN